MGLAVERQQLLRQERIVSAEPNRFTREEKLSEIVREIALRRSVYKRQIYDGRMTAIEAERRIAIMIEIAKDYGGHG